MQSMHNSLYVRWSAVIVGSYRVGHTFIIILYYRIILHRYPSAHHSGIRHNLGVFHCVCKFIFFLSHVHTHTHTIYDLNTSRTCAYYTSRAHAHNTTVQCSNVCAQTATATICINMCVCVCVRFVVITVIII